MKQQTLLLPSWNARWLYVWLAGLALLPAIWIWLDPWTGEAQASLQRLPSVAAFLGAIAPLGKLHIQILALVTFWLVALVMVGRQVARQRLLLLLLCLLATGLTVNVVKLAVWRERPHVEGAPIPRTWENVRSSRGMSFPSGDAATIFAIATATMAIAPRVGAALFVMGFLIGASRLAVGMHHFADVWGALLIGTAVSAWVMQRWRRREETLGKAGQARVPPAPLDNDATC